MTALQITAADLDFRRNADHDTVITPAMDAFIQQQWATHRAVMTHTPTTTRTTCGGRHGGDWDRLVWRGETQATERAYCACCGQMARGNVSPWADAAIDDWFATPYMRRQQAMYATNARRVELAYRRLAVRSLGRTWAAVTFA